MSDYQELRNLITLLDAESEDVRAQVQAELSMRAEKLESFLYHCGNEFPPERIFDLQALLQSRRLTDVRQEWLTWTAEDNPYQKLETAMSFLSKFQSAWPGDETLENLIDQLVEEFLSLEEEPDALSLNRYLFQENRLQGDGDDYYHPLNSNLCHVLKSRKGLPISLVIIYMLCGSRLDLNIQGFNYPGHFFAKVIHQDEAILIDCFKHGRVLGQKDIESLSENPTVPFAQLLQNPPSPEQIIMRVLTNLLNAYYKMGAVTEYRLVQELQNDLKFFTKTGRIRSSKPFKTTHGVLFQPGHVVRHKRYGYRGVVVDLDLECKADDAWYLSNLTQPGRDQPWYHVLVDGSSLTTYPAQSNLEADDSPMKIRHPLLRTYFDGYEEGRYLRNNQPWKLPN